jgi:hypothetical protein
MDNALIVTAKPSCWQSFRDFAKENGADDAVVDSKIEEAIALARVDYRTVTFGQLRDMIDADLDLSKWAPVKADFYSPE